LSAFEKVVEDGETREPEQAKSMLVIMAV